MERIFLALYYSIFPLSPRSGSTSYTGMPALSGLKGLPSAFSISFGIFKKSHRSIFLFVFLGSFQLSFAQTHDSISNRPKIGLVLSGGGAKGLAHIGVLKVIEAAGVKIDYIAGTSMGAIVGGLYASGYTANQLDSIFKNLDHSAVVRDFISRDSKNFYEKSNDERYALSLPFKDFKISVPSAFSKGLYNYNLINKLTYHIRHLRDFDKMPIPFLCVATDIESGNQVILDRGYLPKAIIASSALPSLYTPIEIDGKYLIDGGVVNNYPIEEIKKMGADFIIGVDVQDGLKSREMLQDATKILVQISNLQMIQKMQINKENTDIYIKPNIEKYSVLSFDQGEEIINIGEEAAFAVFEKLKNVGINHPLSTVVNTSVKQDSLLFSIIKTPKLENFTRAYIIGKLGFKEGEKVSYEDLKKGVENLNATQNFSSIHYEINKGEDGDILDVMLAENPVKSFLKLGLHYDGLYKSGLLFNFTKKRVLFKNDVFSADIILGDNFRYNFDYYIDNGFYWSFGVRSVYNQFNRNIGVDFNDGLLLDQLGISSINADYADFAHQVYLQTIFNRKFIIGGGAELRHITIQSNTLQNSQPVFDNSDYFDLYGYLKFDTFDNKYFPTKGGYFNSEIKTFLYSSDFSNTYNNFTILKADFAIIKTFLKKISIKLQYEGGFAMGETSVPFFNFTLGGYGFYNYNNFRPFFGYDFLSLDGNSYLKGSITADWEFLPKQHINLLANYANIGNNIFQKADWFSQIQHSGYALGYGLETIIGPLEIKHSWSPEIKMHYTWFNIGFSF